MKYESFQTVDCASAGIDNELTTIKGKHIQKHKKLSPSPSSQFTIGGNGIEFVDKWPHLGHIISAMHDNKAEILSKKHIMRPDQ